jgi:hypothetical protein
MIVIMISFFLRETLYISVKLHEIAMRACMLVLAFLLTADAWQLIASVRPSPLLGLGASRTFAPLLKAETPDEDKPAAVSEEGSEPAAESEEAPADEGKVDAWGRPIAPAAFSMPSFDFGGSAKPGPTRGQGGLDEQGYERYSKEAASKTTDSTYLVFLGGFALISIALSVGNFASGSN